MRALTQRAAGVQGLANRLPARGRSGAESASAMQVLQRMAGNRAVVATLTGAGPQPVVSVVQRWRAIGPLYKSGWKFSGGTMATHSGLDPLWHASVFREKDTPFFNGFHLTMEYGDPEARLKPHVFFKADGTYDEAATLSHGQTKAYRQAVSPAQWQFDLQTAKDLSLRALDVLGPVLSEEQRQQVLLDAQAAQERLKEKGAAEAAKVAAEEELRAAQVAAAQDEETHVGELLKDVDFRGPTYFRQFLAYIRGDGEAIKDTKLKQVADWYLGGRKAQWVISERPQPAYKDWGRTPVKVDWPAYANCVHKTWRAKDPQTTFMCEYRMLKFTGYASYKLHPGARKPPKV